MDNAQVAAGIVVEIAAEQCQDLVPAVLLRVRFTKAIMVFKRAGKIAHGQLRGIGDSIAVPIWTGVLDDDDFTGAVEVEILAQAQVYGRIRSGHCRRRVDSGRAVVWQVV